MKILILDDEKTVSSAIKFSLQKKGHFVIEYSNPLAALDKLDNEKFDFLVLDYNLHPFSGLDILRLFQNRNFSIPVIIITSNNLKELEDSALSNFNWEIVSKDKPISEIVNHIEVAINKI